MLRRVRALPIKLRSVDDQGKIIAGLGKGELGRGRMPRGGLLEGLTFFQKREKGVISNRRGTTSFRKGGIFWDSWGSIVGRETLQCHMRQRGAGGKKFGTSLHKEKAVASNSDGISPWGSLIAR